MAHGHLFTKGRGWSPRNPKHNNQTKTSWFQSNPLNVKDLFLLTCSSAMSKKSIMSISFNETQQQPGALQI